MNTQWGNYGQDPWDSIDMSQSGLTSSTGIDVAGSAGSAGMGSLANPIIGMITTIAGATGDIVSGITGLKQSRVEAEAMLAAARAQLATGAVQYKQAALNAQLAPYLQAQELAAARERNMLLLTFGFGTLIVGLVYLRRKR